MSLNFEGDNIFYVPEGQMLTFYDIFKMRKIFFNISKFRVHINQLREDIINERVAETLEIIKEESISKYEEKMGKMKSFLGNLSYFDERQIVLTDPKTLTQFLDITFWVRISDIPLETYFDEDYLDEMDSEGDYFNLPTVGGIPLSSLGDFEMNFFDNEFDIILQIPKRDGIIVKPLDVYEFLPIIDEFCGYFGTSNKGNLVNYDLSGKIAKENLCCSPISKKGTNLFQSLYFQIKTEEKFNLTLNVKPDKAIRVLKQMGFEAIKEDERAMIFGRDEDVIHLYSGLPGVEYSDFPIVPTFLIAMQAKGSLEPNDRELLIREMLG